MGEGPRDIRGSRWGSGHWGRGRGFPNHEPCPMHLVVCAATFWCAATQAPPATPSCMGLGCNRARVEIGCHRGPEWGSRRGRLQAPPARGGGLPLTRQRKARLQSSQGPRRQRQGAPLGRKARWRSSQGPPRQRQGAPTWRKARWQPSNRAEGAEETGRTRGRDGAEEAAEETVRKRRGAEETRRKARWQSSNRAEGTNRAEGAVAAVRQS
jgi:hypothetical protein